MYDTYCLRNSLQCPRVHLGQVGHLQHLVITLGFLPTGKKKISQILLMFKGLVVRRPDSAIHWIEIFSTFAKLAVDQYNLRLRFGIYKLKFLRSIVGSRSVVSQLFG